MKNHLVVAVVYNQLKLFEYGCCVEIFEQLRPEPTAAWYRFATCSCDGPLIQTDGGISLNVPQDLSLLSAADTILIPAWRDVHERPPAHLIQALQTAAQRGARICGLCSAAFVLAAAGLLNDKTATTHWRHGDLLARSYPRVRVHTEILYRQEGHIFTSAGSAACLDLLLSLVHNDHGHKIANDLTERLLLATPRLGQQAQRIMTPPIKPQAQAQIALLLDWLKVNLHAPHTLDSLAQRLRMGQRTFQRHFAAYTGMSVLAWLTHVRLRRVQTLLCTTELPLKNIMRLTGFKSEDNLRHHFKQATQLTPSQYRQQALNPVDEAAT